MEAFFLGPNVSKHKYGCHTATIWCIDKWYGVPSNEVSWWKQSRSKTCGLRCSPAINASVTYLFQTYRMSWLQCDAVTTRSISLKHDDVIKWKHFPRYWPFVHRSPVNSPHKGQWRGALMFTLICARINIWVNNREAGDLRRNRVHYDVIVMISHNRHPIARPIGRGIGCLLRVSCLI